MSDTSDNASLPKSFLDGLMLLFLSVLKEASKEQELKIWDTFEKEIAHNNRFFPEAKSVCEALDFYSKKAVHTLHKGEKTIFRTRLISSMEEMPSHTRLIADFSDVKFFQEHMREHAVDNEFLKEHAFWGFDSEGSDASPIDKVVAGRINPTGISYLYASEDPHTAIVEARPTIEQMVSVAEIELKRDLKLFDFCVDLTDENNAESPKRMFEEIARRLSMPNYVGDAGYHATQYISQYIKKLKDSFDGIRFRSALHKGGVNIVLFDTTKDDETKEPLNYAIKNSSIYYVDGITISAKKVLPI